MPDVPKSVLNKARSLGAVLEKRRAKHQQLARYREGGSPIPAAVTRARVTKAYRTLMPMAEAPWADLVVGSTMDRLEIDGVMDPDNQKVADRVWELWQDNAMDNESKLAHDSILTDGRASALVWRDPGEESPQVYLDSMATMAVQYAPGSRRKRIAAMRHWIGEDNRPRANIYSPQYIWKLIGPEYSGGISGVQWEARTELLPDASGVEEWPLLNTLKDDNGPVLPVVELGINRRLKPGTFPYARGEYAHCTGLIDRINLLTFLGLVVAFYMGFPLRGTIGERILVDDDGKAIPPFDAQASGIFQLENPEAKVTQFDAADRGNLSIFPELAQLAMITKTPRHYFPMEGGMANLAADAIRASEGSLHAKVSNYKPQLGEGWVDVNRLMALWDGGESLGPRARVEWKDHESRSLAERADAASKLKDVLPNVAIATEVMGFTRDQWHEWQAENAASSVASAVDQNHPIVQLAQAIREQPVNGNGSTGAPVAQPAG